MSATRLILIDDDRVLHFVMENLLKKLYTGAEVEHYFDGNEVVDVLGSFDPSSCALIFLDLKMSHTSGRDLLRQLEELDWQRPEKVQIILLSSSTDPEDIALAESSDYIEEYLVKPPEAAKVSDIIQRFKALL